MTVDPNQPQLDIGDVPQDPPVEKPVETPAAPAIDYDAVADAVIGKLTKAAEAQAPPPQPPPVNPTTQTSVDEMFRVVNSGDTGHPLYSTYVIQLGILERNRIEDEWGTLGCGSDHPARGMFRHNPAAYSNMPRFAFQAWQLDELRREKDTKQEPSKDDKDKEASRAVRESAPGMPSRSVGGSTRLGSLHMTHADFERRVINEPDLDDKLDRGLIVFTD